MRRMPNNGYTILEVMIFLAVTGMLFVSAMVAVGGRQQAVQYTQSVRDLEIQFRDAINDVSDGYYPEYTDSTCVSTSGNVEFSSAAGSSPGTNVGCSNVGKIMMFDAASENFGLGTIVGINPGINNTGTLSLVNMKPTLAYKEPIIDLTTTKPIRFGAKITKIALVNNPSTTFSSLSFISGFSVSDNTRKENGMLSVDVYGFRGSIKSNVQSSDFVADVTKLADPTATLINQQFYVCMKTTDNKIARVFIGVDGVPTATKTEFDMISGNVCP